MATLKQRLHRKNSSGGYDTVHLETEWSMITGKPSTYPPDSHTHSGYAASTHNHSANQITSGTLPIARGGTGVTTIEALKSALGVGGSGPTGFSYDLTGIRLGKVCWFNYDKFRCVHIAGTTAYLIKESIDEVTAFGSNTTYKGSTAAAKCLTYQNDMAPDSLAKCINWTSEGVSQKVNLITYAQANGGFSWFNSNERRIAYMGEAKAWWTSSPLSSSYVYYVPTDGSLRGNCNPSDTYGFRPCVAVTI